MFDSIPKTHGNEIQLSIITPVYNGMDFIESCLENVIAQIFPFDYSQIRVFLDEKVCISFQDLDDEQVEGSLVSWDLEHIFNDSKDRIGLA